MNVLATLTKENVLDTYFERSVLAIERMDELNEFLIVSTIIYI
jgi:hypothetical protein